MMGRVDQSKWKCFFEQLSFQPGFKNRQRQRLFWSEWEKSTFCWSLFHMEESCVEPGQHPTTFIHLLCTDTEWKCFLVTEVHLSAVGYCLNRDMGAVNNSDHIRKLTNRCKLLFNFCLFSWIKSYVNEEHTDESIPHCWRGLSDG